MNLEERNKLAEENVKLVPYMVDNFFRKHGTKKSVLLGYTKEDFISEGYIELVKAVETFDINRNVKFSTYACKCIENRILNIINYSEYDKRKANTKTVSLEFELNEEERENTLLDILKYHQDYSTAYSNSVLDIIDTFNIKNARFIIEKKVEGYNYKEIAKMLNTSSNAVYQRVKNVQRKLKEIEV